MPSGSISFGQPVKVQVEYQDAEQVAVKAAASAKAERMVRRQEFESRACRLRVRLLCVPERPPAYTGAGHCRAFTSMDGTGSR